MCWFLASSDTLVVGHIAEISAHLMQSQEGTCFGMAKLSSMNKLYTMYNKLVSHQIMKVCIPFVNWIFKCTSVGRLLMTYEISYWFFHNRLNWYPLGMDFSKSNNLAGWPDYHHPARLSIFTLIRTNLKHGKWIFLFIFISS